MNRQIGVGATNELGLRVSVATIVRLRFSNPTDGTMMLALERVATLRDQRDGEGRSEVTVRAKPLGGGVRILDERALRDRIGTFHYDSERSRSEQDFRILIRPSDWMSVKAFCREDFHAAEHQVIDPSPDRELVEEFEDALNVRIDPAAYGVTPIGMVFEEAPTSTANVRAPGMQTVRVYYVFEAHVRDADIIRRVLVNSGQFDDTDLQRDARSDAQRGGRGRANALLAVSLEDLRDAYRMIPVGKRGEPMRFNDHQLDGNVLAILNEVEQLKYLYLA